MKELSLQNSNTIVNTTPLAFARGVISFQYVVYIVYVIMYIIIRINYGTQNNLQKRKVENLLNQKLNDVTSYSHEVDVA